MRKDFWRAKRNVIKSWSARQRPRNQLLALSRATQNDDWEWRAIMQEQQMEMGKDGKGQPAAEVVHMSGSLALTAQAGKEMHVSESAAGALVAGRNMQVTNSLGNALVAGGDIEMKDSVGGVVVAGKSGIVNEGVVGILISQHTVLGEGSRVLLDTPQAIAFGAALGAMFGVVFWLMGKRRANNK